MYNGDDTRFPFSYSQKPMPIQTKYNRPLASQGSYRRNQSLKTPCSQALLDRPAQTIRSPPFSSPVKYQSGDGGGGGGAKKRKGGFSDPTTKPDTDSQLYQTICYTSQGFEINFQIGCDE